MKPHPPRANMDPMPRPSLLEMAGYDTDKGPRYRWVYEQVFAPLRDRPVQLFEIGIFRGGSLLLWRDYFPAGTIVGLDMNRIELPDDSGRIKVYCGKQQDTALLDRIARETAPDGFDIIIDDGSHLGGLSQATFWHLFEKHLRPGGVYIVEDWGTAYWPDWPDGRRYAAPPPDPAAREFPSHGAGMAGFLKQLIDEVAMGEITGNGGVRPAREPRIASIAFSVGQCVIRKP